MFKRIWKLISSTFIIWGNANASRMSAALAYFTMLSLAPLLMIAIAIAGYVFDSQAAQAEIIEQVQLVTTAEIANTVKGLIQNAVEPKTGLVAGTISLCVLVFGASGVFTQLSDTFDDIWKVPPEARSGLMYTLEKRLLGIGMVLIAGLSLLVALVLDSAMAYLNQLVEGSYPQAVIWLNLADRSLSFLLMPFIFAVMFRFFPSTEDSVARCLAGRYPDGAAGCRQSKPDRALPAIFNRQRSLRSGGLTGCVIDLGSHHRAGDFFRSRLQPRLGRYVRFAQRLGKWQANLFRQRFEQCYRRR